MRAVGRDDFRRERGGGGGGWWRRVKYRGEGKLQERGVRRCVTCRREGRNDVPQGEGANSRIDLFGNK